PARVNRERESVLAQLDHRRALPAVDRRSILVVASGHAAAARSTVFRLSNRRVWTRGSRRRAEPPPGAQHAVAVADDELLVQPNSYRQHVWRVRQHHAHAIRDRLRRYGRRGGYPGDALARVRVQGQARRSDTTATAGGAVPSPARLVDVVCGDVTGAARSVAADARDSPARRRSRGGQLAEEHAVSGSAASIPARPLLSLSVPDTGGADTFR